WDGWIDGNVVADFSWDDIEKTHDLMVHWARKDYGSKGSRGDFVAEEWILGKKNTRSCLGVIVCDDPECSTIIRPQTLSGGIQRQLLKRCRCNAKLRRELCDVKMVIWTWKGGKHLLVGPRTLSGQRKSASNISPVYNNRDRIVKDRQRIINSAKYTGGDKFISGFREFHQEHPSFVVHSIFGEINMICMQSDFMCSRLVKGISQCHREPVNGIVSDAAHGFWREHNSLLITSSVYEPELRCWIPILFSYSDGASIEHYTHHFLVLMLSISHGCNKIRISVTDEHFAGIMDFLQAERGGFIEAFKVFWTQDPNDTRSEAELEDASKLLLRGCEEHFHASVTRIKKIHGVIMMTSMHALRLYNVNSLLPIPGLDGGCERVLQRCCSELIHGWRLISGIRFQVLQMLRKHSTGSYT
ncbi:hypothetical protein C8R42DRAFT_531287, partial [Lentinula raphanica]